MYMKKITINGILKEDQYAIAKQVDDYYTELYNEMSTWRPRLDRVVLDKIMVEQKGKLEKEFLRKRWYIL